MAALAVWAVQLLSSWKTGRPGSKRMPTIISAVPPLITPALRLSAAFLVIRCGSKACRSFTSIRSGVDRVTQDRGQRLRKCSRAHRGYKVRLRSPLARVAPDRMLHVLVALLGRLRFR